MSSDRRSPDRAGVIHQTRSGKVRSGKVRSDQIRSGQVRSGEVSSDRVLTVGISAQGPQACVAPFALVSRISSARQKHRQLNKLKGGNTIHISP